MYLDFYGLEKEPFHITPDPDFLFLSPSHKEAFAAFVYGVEKQKGFIALTGEVGTGKTTILRAFLRQVEGTEIRPLYLFDPDITFDELLRLILDELEVDADKRNTRLLTCVQEALIQEYNRNRNLVLIIDDAQNVPMETLEKLRMLSNLETTKDKLLQVVLVGQPELDEILDKHSLRQLKQRIAVRGTVRSLNRGESLDYIEHRIGQARGKLDTIFTPAALKTIVKHAKGNPRTINIVCDNALVAGFGSQRRPVQAGLVKEVIADLRGHAKKDGYVKWVAALAASLALIGAVTLLSWLGNGEPVSGVGERSVAHAISPTSTAIAPAPARTRPITDHTAATVQAMERAAAPISTQESIEEEAAAPVAPEARPSPTLPTAVAITGPRPGQLARGGTANVAIDIQPPAPSVTMSAQAAPAAAVTPSAKIVLASKPSAKAIEPQLAEPELAEPKLAKPAAVETQSTLPIEATPVAISAPPHSVVHVMPSGPQMRRVLGGDALMTLITEAYGFCNKDLIEAVKAHNPKIIDEDKIYTGDKIVFPELVLSGKRIVPRTPGLPTQPAPERKGP